MVAVELTGGLGNQLFGWAAGAWVSAHRRSRLLLDITALPRYPSADETGRRPLALEDVILPVDGLGGRPRFIFTRRRQPLRGEARIRRHLPSRLQQLSGEFWPKPWIVDERLLECRDTVLIRGNVHTFDYAIRVKAEGLELPSPNQLMKDRAARLSSARSTSVALHVRLGDYRTSLPAFLPKRDEVSDRLRRARSLGFTGPLTVFSDEPAAALEYLPVEERGRSDLGLEGSLGLASPAEVLFEIASYPCILPSSSSLSGWAGILASESSLVLVPEGMRRLLGPSSLPTNWIEGSE